ncbi:FAD/NAD(P)-binding domain-containing protein [Suillus brevipes Sb2]|nr:FAD/NAD(P)-binding domain-containing protein [Suillus brevipes Sb2]
MSSTTIPIHCLPRKSPAPPTRENQYCQHERPLSFQPRCQESNTQSFNNYGFPRPGIQSPSAHQLVAKDFLISDETWEDLQMGIPDLDFVVIGSGLAALAFIDNTLKRDSRKKILCLERGDFWLPDHFQNLPPPFKYTPGGPCETFPFTLSKQTYESDIKFVHGSCPFFGGRSTFWSAWSPSPTAALMRNWPESLVATAQKPGFFKLANKLLRVTKATDIGPPYGKLQRQIDQRLQPAVAEGDIFSAQEAYPAPMAVASIAKTSTIHFNKFSTPGPLLSLYKEQQRHVRAGTGAPLLFATQAAVQYLGVDVGFPSLPSIGDEESVTFLRTSRGDLPIAHRTKIILCAGAFPNATLLLNSFRHNKYIATSAGKMVTGHFVTHVVARVKRSAFYDLNQESIEIGAEYLAGQHPTSHLQYHIQVTAIASPDPTQDAEDAARFCPDFAGTASEEQLRGSEDYVIFVCATLGELSENNKNSFFRLSSQPLSGDPTSNCILQVIPDEKDYELWDQMDEATLDAIRAMAGNKKHEVEWWHQPKPWDKPGVWKREIPGKETIRMEGIVHEASVLPLGDGDEYCVNRDYRVKGVSNVYVTGAAIFPTSGSWNPTLTMCGFAQDLARKLTARNPGGKPDRETNRMPLASNTDEDD